MKNYRPDEWIKQRNIFFEMHQPKKPYYKTREIDYEAGADAILEAIWKRARESPTGTFTFDTHITNIFKENDA